ncbi:hypothetical protein U9M48_025689 [Paspalum notatum var. saurae]|uniref:Leucine-rich repeat-containing N-terminal plant-type domain-containing protein n=1 Tax=Paspalum notatum var. saurae TaxID=547442 RepID=A0AAQ3TQC4_PASNO
MQSAHFSNMTYNSRLPLPVLPVSLVLLASLLAIPASSCTGQEKTSLLEFLAGLSQDSSLAKSWQEDGTDCCKWEGVTCNGNKTVIQVSLPSRGLKGRIAPSLGNLTGLQHLNLSYNSLYGGLPQELVSSSSMVVLDVSFNQLNGDLHELSSSTSVQWPLQGVLDGKHIFKLSNLVILDLGENNFTGRIPDTIGQLRRLQEIDLDFNNMYGELPSSLSNCTDLIMINLRNNGFSGELAKVNFSNLENLKTLDLAWNNFIGTIPESIYSCVKLTALRLSYNNLHGQLSNGIGNLKSLSFLSLVDNNLTDITNALHILRGSKSLTTLLIGSNFMNETMPVYDGPSRQYRIPIALPKVIDLSSNHFTDKTAAHLDSAAFELPVYEGKSSQYRSSIAFPKALCLNNNELTGVIPQEIGQLKALQALDVSSNNLKGPIPSSVCNLTNLQALDLSNNNLTGEIPSALDSLSFLSAFNISNNNLEGPIPTGGQFSTFTNSSFGGNPRLCGPVFNKNCGPAEAGPAVSVVYTDELWGSKVIAAVAFVVFIGVGVLYDQMVLSRYFG